MKNSNLTKRIIACLDVKNGRVVKGVQFTNLRDNGDPAELGARYAREGADELVFLDIAASSEGRGTVLEMVRKVAREVFIPFTVGGGVRSVDDMRDLLKAGADKVSVNSSAVRRPELISEGAAAFGSQCIVVAIDAKKVGAIYKVFVKGGREETDLEVVSWAREACRLGAGEILLTSMDRDGTREGFDCELLAKVSEAVSIPVIASGGAGSAENFYQAFSDGGADAALAAGIFHDAILSVQEVKKYLQGKGVEMRMVGECLIFK